MLETARFTQKKDIIRLTTAMDARKTQLIVSTKYHLFCSIEQYK